jgi:quercetin dioxygenase-like cupin family protein
MKVSDHRLFHPLSPFRYTDPRSTTMKIETAMILKNLATAPKQTVAMQGAKNVQMQLLCGPDDGCPTFAMRQFIVAPGGCTPRHHHDYEHEVLILAGEGTAFAQNADHPIKPGDVLFIPANELHQFRNTGSEPLHFICLVPAFVHKPGAPQPVAIDCTADSAAT